MLSSQALKCAEDSGYHNVCRREYSQISEYFLARGGKICVKVTIYSKQLCGGMEIACRFVLGCSSRVKINRLKDPLEKCK